MIWERLALQIVALEEKPLEYPQLVIFNHCNRLSKEAPSRNRVGLSGLSKAQLWQWGGGRPEKGGERESREQGRGGGRKGSQYSTSKLEETE